jgi:hypothetical protein
MARITIIAKASAGLAMTLTSLLAVTQAEAASDTANARSACRSDYTQYCKGTTPGGGRIIKCLADHADQLSPSCKSAMADAKAAKDAKAGAK